MIADLCEHYKWPPDFWRPMTWPELTGHLRELTRRRSEQHEGVVTAPETWAGAERDPFFAAHFAKGRRK